MTNATLMKIALVRNNMTVLELCARCGFSAGYFYRCLRGEQDFRTSEVKAICDVLRIESEEMNSIFFNLDVGKTSHTEATPNQS